MNTKIHLAIGGEGRPIRFILTPGQVNDSTQALALLDGLSPRNFLADKGYDSHAIFDAVEECGAQPIIPQRSQMKGARAFDPRLHKKRNLVEREASQLHGVPLPRDLARVAAHVGSASGRQWQQGRSPQA